MSKLNGQMPKKYDVVTIDDALVDEFYACSDAELAARRIPVEERTGEDDARTLLTEKGKTQRSSGPEEVETFAAGLNCVAKAAGGGATNTLAMMQHYGAKTAFCGKLGVGDHADYFRDSLQDAGIDNHEIPSENPLATGTCKVFVTPDCERTMVARLPNQVSISTQDIDAHAEEMLHDAEILFAQGYRWAPASREGFRRAFERMHQLGGKVAFSLSDSFCVEDSRADFLGFIENGTVDILFANEKEIQALYPGKTDDEIIETLATETAKPGACKTVALTFGKQGSIIIDNGKIHTVDTVAVAPKNIVDVTGAGDAYAAGVLYGFTHGQTAQEAGNMGSWWASQIIQHYGARPNPSQTVSAIERVVARAPRNHPYSASFDPSR